MFVGHANSKPIISYIGDITDVNCITEAFEGVSCVIHCASLVSYEYPPNKEQLHLVNVEGNTLFYLIIKAIFLCHISLATLHFSN